MGTLECGCWSGPWQAIIPPPQCAHHAQSIWAGAESTDAIYQRAPALTPPLTPDQRRDATIARISDMLTTWELDVPENRSPDPLSEGLGCMLALGRQLITLRNGAPWEVNPAAHDAWQLAVELLAPVLVAIERARHATPDKER